MRKTYQSPKCEIFKIEAQHLLAGSERIPEGSNNYQKGDAVLSRGGGDWNDDEE